MLRLLRLRGMEEDRRRMALEIAVRELRNLEDVREAAIAGDRLGRELVKKSVLSGEPADRVSGLVEIAAARREVHALAPRIAASEGEGLRLRREFFEKHTERRQAEILVEETRALEQAESDRRSQQALDDLYGSRRYREIAAAKQDEKSPSAAMARDSTSLP